MKKKIAVLFLTFILAVSMLGGCGTYSTNSSNDSTNNTSADDSQNSNTSSGDTQTDNSTGDADTTSSMDTINVSAGTALTLNQFVSQASNDYDALYLLMSSLVRYYDGTIENDAAKSYDISEDGLTYTFHLQDNLLYSDGTSVTAEDFRYAILKTIAPDSGASSLSYYLGIKGATAYNSAEGTKEEVAVTAVDEKTLEITLEKENKAFIKAISIYPVFPVREEFAESLGEEYGTSPETILCSGPYTLTEWTIDTSMTFEKNDSWWNAANEFPIKTVNILDIDSANTEVSMFENGELDIAASVDTNYLATLDGFIKSYEGSTEMFLWIKETGTSDEATAVLSNLNFRMALTYALDRSAISGAVSKGFIGTNRAVSANYPTATGKYVEQYTVDTAPVSGNIELAQQYLAAALSELGYSDVSELPAMTYMSFERDDMKLLGETITDIWKQSLGITSIQFVQYPIGTAIQNFYTGNYDMFMISLGCSVSADDIIKSFTSTGDYSFFSADWSTDITDMIADANNEEYDSDVYYQKIAAAEEALLNEYSFVPLYNQTFYYAIAEGVEGYVEPGAAFQFQFNHLTFTK